MGKWKLEIRPLVSAKEPIVRNDGRVEVVPLQVFRLYNGGVGIRVGHSIFFFDDDGRYNGSEHKADKLVDGELEKMHAFLEASVTGVSKPPDEPYFKPGSSGHHAEVKGWEQSVEAAHPAASELPAKPGSGKLH